MTLLPPILFLRLPYLPHKGDTPDLDDADGTHGFSIVSQVTDILNNALNPTCASNAISLLCHTFFKECKAVEDATTGTQLWLPSLLCRSECDRHLEAWNTCLGDLGKDPDAKRSFDTQMLAMVHVMIHTSVP
jgi:hypothetical protein